MSEFIQPSDYPLPRVELATFHAVMDDAEEQGAPSFFEAAERHLAEGNPVIAELMDGHALSIGYNDKIPEVILARNLMLMGHELLMRQKVEDGGSVTDYQLPVIQEEVIVGVMAKAKERSSGNFIHNAHARMRAYNPVLEEVLSNIAEDAGFKPGIGEFQGTKVFNMVAMLHEMLVEQATVDASAADQV